MQAEVVNSGPYHLVQVGAEILSIHTDIDEAVAMAQKIVHGGYQPVRHRKAGTILGDEVWIVEIFSPVTKKWIVQGEWNTEAEAKADAASWN